MKKRTKTEDTYELDIEDLKHAMSIVIGTSPDFIRSITEIKTSEEVPGLDPHDCDYIETFSGLKVVVSEKG